MTRIRLEYVHEYRDRHGKLRRYFRRPGFKQIALPGLPGSAEFMAACEQALAGLRKEIGADRTKPGTVNAAIVGYYTCLAFRELAPSTQAKRRVILESFRNQHGSKRISSLPQYVLVRMLNQIKKPVMARHWLTALRGLLEFAVKERFCASNPAQGIKLPKWKGGHHRAWTDAEVEQYEAAHPVGSKARAFALGLYTVQRVSDVVRMGRQHIRNDELTVEQKKTGVRLALPILPELQAALNATPSRHMTFLVNENGGQYRGNPFSEQFRLWCNEAGLPKDCVFHGLRATGCTILADAGCSDHQIAAWSGHKTLKQVESYTRAASQKRLARSAGDAVEETPT